jgi:hypothetical protein
MKHVLLLIVMVISLEAVATVTSGTGSCPEQFEGRVKEIIEPVGSIDAFSTNQVIFENLRTLKGNVSDRVIIEVLQNGPFKPEVEKDYKVQLRQDKLCWIEEL